MAQVLSKSLRFDLHMLVSLHKSFLPIFAQIYQDFAISNQQYVSQQFSAVLFYAVQVSTPYAPSCPTQNQVNANVLVPLLVGRLPPPGVASYKCS